MTLNSVFPSEKLPLLRPRRQLPFAVFAVISCFLFSILSYFVCTTHIGRTVGMKAASIDSDIGIGFTGEIREPCVWNRHCANGQYCKTDPFCSYPPCGICKTALKLDQPCVHQLKTSEHGCGEHLFCDTNTKYVGSDAPRLVLTHDSRGQFKQMEVGVCSPRRRLSAACNDIGQADECTSGNICHPELKMCVRPKTMRMGARCRYDHNCDQQGGFYCSRPSLFHADDFGICDSKKVAGAQCEHNSLEKNECSGYCFNGKCHDLAHGGQSCMDNSACFPAHAPSGDRNILFSVCNTHTRTCALEKTLKRIPGTLCTSSADSCDSRFNLVCRKPFTGGKERCLPQLTAS